MSTRKQTQTNAYNPPYCRFLHPISGDHQPCTTPTGFRSKSDILRGWCAHDCGVRPLPIALVREVVVHAAIQIRHPSPDFINFLQTPPEGARASCLSGTELRHDSQNHRLGAARNSTAKSKQLSRIAVSRIAENRFRIAIRVASYQML